MISTINPIGLDKGSDCREAFKAAYENRYTWEPGFSGYSGCCSLLQDESLFEGSFDLGINLKPLLKGFDDESIEKLISSQLWEVAIHRVRRSFEQTHGQNTFTVGENDSVGTEVLVGGKNSGDRYRIKNNVVTMVHRHIHGILVTIFTKEIFDTGRGYLSTSYSSQYCDPSTGAPISGISNFKDIFIPLENSTYWVLSERTIQTEKDGDNPSRQQVFKFFDMKSS